MKLKKLSDKKKKVVCIGARFGQFYFEAVSKSEDLELCGIVSKGSERSRKCAEYYNVPLYAHIEQIPEDTDIVCIAVSSASLGGEGGELAAGLLKKGIAVIMEQPIHENEIKNCIKLAKINKTHFMIGNLYANLKAVKEYIRIIQLMQNKQKPLYINVDMSTQVAYPLSYVLAAMFPKCRKLESIGEKISGREFQMLQMDLDGIPLAIRAQNQVDTEISDNFTYLFFKITVGFEMGSFELTDVHGDIVFRERMSIPNKQMIPVDLQKQIGGPLNEKSLCTLYETPKKSYKDILSYDWTDAIYQDISMLSKFIEGDSGKQEMRLQMLHLQASKFWHSLTAAVGYPSECRHERQKHISLYELRKDIFRDLSMEERYNRLQYQAVNDQVSTLNKGCIASIGRVFIKNGIFADKNTYSFEKIIKAVHVKNEFVFVVKGWLKLLQEQGYIKKEEEGYRCISETLGILAENEGTLWKEACEQWDFQLGTEEVSRYFYQNAKELENMLTGKTSARFLLFPNGKDDIAKDLYRKTMIAWYMNHVIANKICSLAKSESKLRILEVGAGTGSTTEIIAEEIIKNGLEDKIEQYMFTDVSNYFLEDAKQTYPYDWFETSLLHLDHEKDYLNFPDESFDVIVAAGVLNNVENIDFVLENLKAKLSVNGIILISEAVTESVPMLISQIFMMKPANDAREESMTAFVLEEQWKIAFLKTNLRLLWNDPYDGHKLEALGQRVFCVQKIADIE